MSRYLALGGVCLCLFILWFGLQSGSGGSDAVAPPSSPPPPVAREQQQHHPTRAALSRRQREELEDREDDADAVLTSPPAAAASRKMTATTTTAPNNGPADIKLSAAEIDATLRQLLPAAAVRGSPVDFVTAEDDLVDPPSPLPNETDAAAGGCCRARLDLLQRLLVQAQPTAPPAIFGLYAREAEVRSVVAFVDSGAPAVTALLALLSPLEERKHAMNITLVCETASDKARAQLEEIATACTTAPGCEPRKGGRKSVRVVKQLAALPAPDSSSSPSSIDLLIVDAHHQPQRILDHVAKFANHVRRYLIITNVGGRGARDAVSIFLSNSGGDGGEAALWREEVFLLDTLVLRRRSATLGTSWLRGELRLRPPELERKLERIKMQTKQQQRDAAGGVADDSESGGPALDRQHPHVELRPAGVFYKFSLPRYRNWVVESRAAMSALLLKKRRRGLAPSNFLKICTGAAAAVAAASSAASSSLVLLSEPCGAAAAVAEDQLQNISDAVPLFSLLASRPERELPVAPLLPVLAAHVLSAIGSRKRAVVRVWGCSVAVAVAALHGALLGGALNNVVFFPFASPVAPNRLDFARAARGGGQDTALPPSSSSSSSKRRRADPYDDINQQCSADLGDLLRGFDAPVESRFAPCELSLSRAHGAARRSADVVIMPAGVAAQLVASEVTTLRQSIRERLIVYGTNLHDMWHFDYTFVAHFHTRHQTQERHDKASDRDVDEFFLLSTFQEGIGHAVYERSCRPPVDEKLILAGAVPPTLRLADLRGVRHNRWSCDEPEV